jgi:hypothetical protein
VALDAASIAAAVVSKNQFTRTKQGKVKDLVLNKYLSAMVFKPSMVEDVIPDFETWTNADMRQFETPQFQKDLKAEIEKIIPAEEASESDTSKQPVPLEDAYLKFNSLKVMRLADLTIYCDEATEKPYLIHEPTRELIKFTQSNLEKLITSQFNVATLKDFNRKKFQVCRTQYRPNMPQIVEERGEMVFNPWTPAEWSKDWTPATSQTHCPEPLQRLIKDMVTHEKAQSLCLAWLMAAVFHRADCCLILHGTAGIGKNLFSEHLLSALVGFSNYGKAGSRVSSGFDGHMYDKKIIAYDEKNLTETLRNQIKEFVGQRYYTFEDKGKTPEMKEIYCSVIFNSNLPEATDEGYKTNGNYLSLMQSDRKFYVPDLQPVSWVQKYGEEENNRFGSMFVSLCENDHRFLKDVADFLVTNFKQGSHREFLKKENKETETFMKSIRKSLPSAIRSILHYHQHNLKSPGKRECHAIGNVLKSIPKDPVRFADSCSDYLKRVDPKPFVVEARYRDKGKPAEWVIIFNPDSESESAAE